MVRGFRLCSKLRQGCSAACKASNHTWGLPLPHKARAASESALVHVQGVQTQKALRFLLPGANFWDEAGTALLRGGPALGPCATALAARVDHLQSAVAEEPQPRQPATRKKTFLTCLILGARRYRVTSDQA